MPEYNVLIVDDSPFMRKVFSDVIDADAAFNVLATAGNGKEAVELALKLKPDIITMDLEMPQMNGIEALQRIMSVRPTPVIMLSAVTDNGTRDTIKALQHGAFDFIRKPDGAVKLDIHQVGEQLIEKLHIAVSTVSMGSFRMMPAVEEKTEPIPKAEPLQQVSAIESRHEAPPAADLPPPAPKPDSPAKEPPRLYAESKRTIAEPPKTPSTQVESRTPASSPPAGQREAAPKPAAAEARAAQPLPRATEPKPAAKSLVKKAAAAAAMPAPPPVTAEPLSPVPPRPQPKSKSASSAFADVVAIGTSTGGPRALHEVLTGIPAGFPAPILIVQHMPPKFTHSLAQRLDSFCNIRVCEATDGELVESATAYIAPGGRHMSLIKDALGGYRIRLSDDPPRSGHRPSVDYLFESLIDYPALKRHAVLMTGMGSDGAKGMKALQTGGAQTLIAESEETCVVYGMPRSAIELGAATQVLPLQAISSALAREVRPRKT
ncbi:chemotaxis response regulator protein-glutamate methylesterase [Cohnella sp. GCM10027633]|uniref:protein-glutamate methylesterase/protein-glutamine glutaminase n=1 Tax=unclassified Cohnella TaxID=2636738 RepID=UPI0036329F53